MLSIPKSEKKKFEDILCGQAQRFGLTPEEYLRKVWYHEEASRLGEYVAMSLVDEILPLVPASDKETAEKAG